MYANELYTSIAVVLLLVGIVVEVVLENLHNVLKRGYWIEAVQTTKQVLEVFAMICFGVEVIAYQNNVNEKNILPKFTRYKFSYFATLTIPYPFAILYS